MRAMPTQWEREHIKGWTGPARLFSGVVPGSQLFDRSKGCNKAPGGRKESPA